MKWRFKCPLCNDARETDWENHGKRVPCSACKKERTVPGPAQQPSAYVDQRDPPEEMKDVVFLVKGTSCVINGCKAGDITLDHIVAWDNNGRTSVDNLQPMCASHNSSKGAEDFASWLHKNGLTKRR